MLARVQLAKKRHGNAGKTPLIRILPRQRARSTKETSLLGGIPLSLSREWKKEKKKSSPVRIQKKKRKKGKKGKKYQKDKRPLNRNRGLSDLYRIRPHIELGLDSCRPRYVVNLDTSMDLEIFGTAFTLSKFLKSAFVTRNIPFLLSLLL